MGIPCPYVQRKPENHLGLLHLWAASVWRMAEAEADVDLLSTAFLRTVPCLENGRLASIIRHERWARHKTAIKS